MSEISAGEIACLFNFLHSYHAHTAAFTSVTSLELTERTLMSLSEPTTLRPNSTKQFINQIAQHEQQGPTTGPVEGEGLGAEATPPPTFLKIIKSYR